MVLIMNNSIHRSLETDLFQIAGSLFGGLSRCFGNALALKTDDTTDVTTDDTSVEKRIVKDYNNFLRSL
jgi:hypothetical protein